MGRAHHARPVDPGVQVDAGAARHGHLDRAGLGAEVDRAAVQGVHVDEAERDRMMKSLGESAGCFEEACTDEEVCTDE